MENFQSSRKGILISTCRIGYTAVRRLVALPPHKYSIKFIRTNISWFLESPGREKSYHDLRVRFILADWFECLSSAISPTKIPKLDTIDTFRGTCPPIHRIKILVEEWKQQQRYLGRQIGNCVQGLKSSRFQKSPRDIHNSFVKFKLALSFTFFAFSLIGHSLTNFKRLQEFHHNDWTPICDQSSRITYAKRRFYYPSEITSLTISIFRMNKSNYNRRTKSIFIKIHSSGKTRYMKLQKFVVS